MRLAAIGLAAATAGGISVMTMAQAAQPPPQNPIVGQDVMGDTARSGPDGWAQAPVTRNQAASGRAPGQTDAAIRSAPNAQPGPDEGKTLPRGQDPGAPATGSASGPGTLDAPAAARGIALGNNL